jgi:hypothetical protein
MSCAQRKSDSASAAVDLEAASEGMPGSLVRCTAVVGHRVSFTRPFAAD